MLAKTLKLILLSLAVIGIDGHGYMSSPRSLNFIAHQDGVDGMNVEGVPKREYCHHCLNTKLVDEVCGRSSRSYDDFLDSMGKPIPWKSEETYVEGGLIHVKSVLTAHHWGHMEIRACPDVDNPTFECFDKYPLEFVEDPKYGAPKNSEYSIYGHFADKSKMEYEHIYRLPKGLKGDKVLLQWKYITANSCFPPGYRNYAWPSNDWKHSGNLGDCTPPYMEDGSRPSGSPEQFWNCARITIINSDPTISPAPTPEVKVTPSPTASPNASPTKGFCTFYGGCGNPGNSEWCDATEERCKGCGGEWCVSGPSPPTPPTPPTPTPPTPPTPPTSSPKVATTTRYWDCSGGACGCAYLPGHLGGDFSKPAHCYSNALFEAPPNNVYGANFYGTAAVSKALGGGDWLSDACGKCWKVTGKANVPGYNGRETTLVLRGANYCPPNNAACAEGLEHFDIAAPGFDVTAYSLSNTCRTREPAEIAGFEACGDWMISSQDPSINCECDRFIDPTLKAGCENFLSLGWDNVDVTYTEVSCPEEMETPCYENNNYPPFGNIPDTCIAPTLPVTEAPTSAPTSDESNECSIEESFQIMSTLGSDDSNWCLEPVGLINNSFVVIKKCSNAKMQNW
eukprot:CAMPEP_0184861872 /NCGR_PEP_ID=MMETSP0580-20130426/6455_1 /TAXON_ID=1118495 /ORGANISM="Dactyliosolen fragilissimus" /LENGTH=621 /DNA_ID=CAMNT_0027359529 /DNA_START=146 /DNA_END=2008 /DNA_ORIENTATION=+